MSWSMVPSPWLSRMLSSLWYSSNCLGNWSDSQLWIVCTRNRRRAPRKVELLLYMGAASWTRWPTLTLDCTWTWPRNRGFRNPRSVPASSWQQHQRWGFLSTRRELIESHSVQIFLQTNFLPGAMMDAELLSRQLPCLHEWGRVHTVIQRDNR